MLIHGARADAAFQELLQSLWPRGADSSASRAPHSMRRRAGSSPICRCPIWPCPAGRNGRPQQPEFVQTPADYRARRARSRGLPRRAASSLDAIPRDARRDRAAFGVQPSVLLAIWGRETDLRRLQAAARRASACWRRRPIPGSARTCFARSFCCALKMLQDGVPRARHAQLLGRRHGAHAIPAVGLFYKYAVDFDGDGRADIWTSVPDALASAAKQLADKGWQRGLRWAYEVRPPADVDCTIAQPEHTSADRRMAAARLCAGLWPQARRPRSCAEPASLLLPAGLYGPAFLAPKNYFVIKDYNFSDLYVLFVGHLSDRIVGSRGRSRRRGARSRSCDTRASRRCSRRLTARGLYHDKIDGKAGMQTRAALGAYQKANGLKVDCWPTAARARAYGAPVATLRRRALLLRAKNLSRRRAWRAAGDHRPRRNS